MDGLRVRVTVEAESKTHHLALVLGQRLKRSPEFLLRQRKGEELLGAWRTTRDELAECCSLILGRDRPIEAGDGASGVADGGDSWKPIVRDLPAVFSVEAQTLP